eukprot:1139715-Pelagomonas_calceolata.AAC.6
MQDRMCWQNGSTSTGVLPLAFLQEGVLYASTPCVAGPQDGWCERGCAGHQLSAGGECLLP